MREALDFERLLKHALRVGVTATEFWDLTPRETIMTLEAALWRQEQHQKDQIALAWYVAALSRAKRLPNLKQLLAGPAKPLKGNELKRRRSEYQELTTIDLSALEQRVKHGKSTG